MKWAQPNFVLTFVLFFIKKEKKKQTKQDRCLLAHNGNLLTVDV
jgi:hypothetical protein